MKKIIPLFLLVPLFSYSQITVTSANLPNIGDTVITAYDNGSYTPGASGPNQVWNFSNAAGTPEMILGFIDPASTPYQASFPSSNLCVQVDSLVYYYLDRSVNGLSAVGIVDSGMVYPYNQMILLTPLNYLDTITNTSILYQWDTVLSPPIPAAFVIGIPGPYVIDSVKQAYGNHDKYIVDSWGQLQVPSGSYDALRIFESHYEFESLSFRLIDTITGVSQWMQDTSSTDFYWESSRYSWRTNDSTIAWSLAEIETDSAGNPYGDIMYYLGNSLSNIVVSPPIVDIDKLVDVSCYGNTDGFIMLDIQGTAPPFSCVWSNGQTGTTLFNLPAGVYTVIVTDANGNSVTESYMISEPPQLVATINQSGYDITAIVNGGTPPYNYLWNTGDTLVTITPSSNGIYTCSVVDKAGCSTTVSFNVNNLPSGILSPNDDKRLVKIIDVFGRIVVEQNNTTLFYIYDDGTIEKKIIIE